MSTIILASALALSLQVEAGETFMQKPADDIFVEYRLPDAQDTVRFNTFTFGAALRLDAGPFVFTGGWRDLGNQKADANIIPDGAYFACRYGKTPCVAGGAWPMRWFSTGDEQQRYLEVGYKIRLGSYELVPSAGVAQNTTCWHFRFYSLATPDHVRNATEDNERMLAPFAGLTLQRGPVGIGVYWLYTHPTWTADNNFDGQGETATYVRVTYAFGR